MRHKLRPKQWRTVGVADSCITSIFQRDIYELTACPRAEQISCICFELTGTCLVSKLLASGMSLGL